MFRDQIGVFGELADITGKRMIVAEVYGVGLLGIRIPLGCEDTMPADALEADP